MPRGKTLSEAESKAVIPEVVAAALGAKTFTKATTPFTDDDRACLTRYLKPDVETWRAEFCQRLRAAASDCLADLHESLTKVPPAAKAYTFAVLQDKLTAMEGRNSLSGAQVNIQINQFSSSTPKEALLAAIAGKSLPTPPASLTPAQTPQGEARSA